MKTVHSHTHTHNQMEIHTFHLDLLDDLNELHLCRHVAHGPHAVCDVFVMDEAIRIVVKLLKGLLEL